jgi:DNA polymerase-3 subunit alpha
VNARQKVGGKFETYEQFEMAVEKRACNARIREGLMRVGAFASIQPGTSPADAEDRKKDQAELMGSLFTGTVKIGRVFESTPRKTAELSVLMEEMRSKLGLGEYGDAIHRPEAKGHDHPEQRQWQ